MRLYGKEKLSKTRTSKLRTIARVSVARVTAEILVPTATARIAFMLATVINMKFAENKASFLLLGLRILGGVILSLIIVLAGHLAWTFLTPIYITVLTAAVRDIDSVDSGS